MKQADQKVSVSIESLTSKKSEGQVTIHSFSGGQKVKRFLVTFGAWMFVALLLVGLPLIHIIMVPLVVLIGLIHGSVRSARGRKIAGGLGTCPECSAPLTIVERGYTKKFSELCESCGRQLSVTQKGTVTF